MFQPTIVFLNFNDMLRKEKFLDFIKCCKYLVIRRSLLYVDKRKH